MFKILYSRRTLIATISMTYLLILGIVVKADVVGAIVLIATSLSLGNAAEGILSKNNIKQKNKTDTEQAHRVIK